MSDATFQELWRGVRLYAPDLPLPLAQEFIRFSYDRASKAIEWSQLKARGEFYIPAAETTGTVSVLNGATTVSGAGTAFTAAMVGRQIVFADQGVPWYDIVAVDVGGQELTLDRAYSGPDLSGEEYEINLIYATAPADFDFFLSVVDTTREWRLYHDVPQALIDNWDPKRLKTAGDPWVLSPAGAQPLALQTAGVPRHRYEVWPRTGDTARRITFKYQKTQPALSTPSARPFWPLSREVLIEGALARLAMWKGTADAPNPYYDLNLYRFHQENFLRELHKCELEDQRVSQTWVDYADADSWPFAPIDGAYLQRHDVWPLIGHR